MLRCGTKPGSRACEDGRVHGARADRYDVLVVGGGPAGAAAGYWLAERGHRVLIVEKKRFLLKDKERFDRFIRAYWSAQMLATEGLTRPVSAAQARAGDLCLIDWSDSTFWHTIIVGPRDDGELPQWLVMGNLAGGQATPLELVDRETQRARVRRYFQNPDLHEGSPRRWSFDWFNDPA